MKVSGTVIAAILITAVISGCAASSPDFGRRTSGGPGQEAKLAALFEEAKGVPRSDNTQKISMPFCSSTAGQPSTGLAIDGGNWCVVGCKSSGNTEPRWVRAENGNRCLAAPNSGATKQVEFDFKWSDLSLEQPALFKGLGRSFLSDTEWHCKEFNYLIDPDNNRGFWNVLRDGRKIYRFHRDGKLLTGRSLDSMKLSGSWQVNTKKQVFFNSVEVFKHSIDYGGGRFDYFKSATNKEVCRYVREAELPS